jgi:phosphoglucomutase
MPPVADMTAALGERYGKQGAAAAAALERWLSGAVPYAEPETLERHLDERHLDLLFDSFRQTLPFGTGGRRGPVGYGPNRMNFATVAMTIEGHCRYIREKFPEERPTVVVANDVRTFHDLAGVYSFLPDDHPLIGVSSRAFARFACEIYARNGIVAYLAAPKADPDGDDALLATPELSFAIVQLGAAGGVNFSASHNPPDDNGAKVYDSRGAQPVPPVDFDLAELMEDVGDGEREPFADALAAGRIRALPDEVHESYVAMYLDVYGGVHRPTDESIVYTPLCGCGLTTVKTVADRIGFAFDVPPDQGPDGTFASIPFHAPNPEVPQATTPAKAYAEEVGSSVVLSSDPDADRVGVDVRQPDGTWRHLTGNQIAAVLANYLMVDPAGPRKRGLVIETCVTTKLLGRIAQAADGSPVVDDLLVGFKYVADVLQALKDEGRWKGIEAAPGDLVLAAEESHGVSTTAEVRDKDSTPAAIFLAALHQRLSGERRTLFDYYLDILERFGGYAEVARSIVMTGAKGVEARHTIMNSLRAEPPGEIGGVPVRRGVDYLDTGKEVGLGAIKSPTDWTSRDVLEHHLEGFIVTVRPSGTEPKVKLYVHALPSGAPDGASGAELFAEANARAGAMATSAYNALLDRVGARLSEPALLLPDIVPLDSKLDFDERLAPELRERLGAAGGDSLEDVLSWLRAAAAAMTPGSDPLPGLKEPIALLVSEWARDDSPRLLGEIQRWAAE